MTIIRPETQIAVLPHTDLIYAKPFNRLGYSWFNDNPVPASFFRLIFVPEQGFIVQLLAREANPLARYTRTDDPVYKDSCLEFFADFFPQLAVGYLNFEMNANGAILCQIGTSRVGRKPVTSLGISPPQPTVSKNDSAWQARLEIPLAFIQQIYGRSDFSAGQEIRANFYKCGDDLPAPHFGSWADLGQNPGSFHQPENFVAMRLTKTIR